VSVVEGRGILKRELGLSSISSNYTTTARGATRRPPRGDGPRRVTTTTTTAPRYTDDDDEDDSGENFFTATGHRLWNSISNRVDDLRTGEGVPEGRIHDDDEEEGGGLLGRIPRPKWLGRGESGVSVWRLPRWGRADEGRVVL
jgi:hypothetical protein